MTFPLPLLSEYDPGESTEGTIDPLGLYAIADSLALKLVPGVRERQSHPRFLTSMSVSLHLMEEFDEEIIADDGISEPWQVFEWYVVQGLEHRSENEAQIHGLPGREKAAQARKDKVPLSAKRYLKTPTVFGFHGVYRTLARNVDVQSGDRLGQTGWELLEIWSREQGLKGFIGSAGGTGKNWRSRIIDAVADGLKAGATDRSWQWGGWNFIRDHMGIYESGREEKKRIALALLDPLGGHRKSVLEHIIKNQDDLNWNGNNLNERHLHTSLMEQSDGELRELLEVIQKYELFARMLTDAFTDCRLEMSQSLSGKASLKEMSTLPSVKRATEMIPELYPQILDLLLTFGESGRFSESFTRLADKCSSEDWTALLLDHHVKIQQGKPPNGKTPWFHQHSDGSFWIRQSYVRKTGGKHNDDFVHAYRANPLWSFAKDLTLVK